LKQTIRIIGGLYRGKKLQFPEVEGLRPTPDRVRETVFNWLMNHVRNARCLDAFAGSGALGFEAFSRGAAEVVFIEQSLTASTNLGRIIKEFDTTQLKLVKADSLLYLKQQPQAFDIIFLDPPYALNYIPECLDLIEQNSLLKDSGLIYYESASTLEINTEYWQEIKAKKAGQVYYGLLQKR